jgi:spore coat polysaccharide biosynthesis protein SpsF
MRVIAIIQARAGSTRLPAKVLMDLSGATMLARVIGRTRRATTPHEVVVATTVEPADHAIVEECARLQAPCFRGNETDVLDRYYHAALCFNAAAVVRITADCPLIDPMVLDDVVHAFLRERPDYASNTLERTYPRGLDVEIMTFDALHRAWCEADALYQRAHVTPYLYQNPGIFRLRSVTCAQKADEYRWTVDTPEDLAFAREVYARLGNREDFGWHDVLDLHARDPELAEQNRHIAQKALHEG